MKASTVTKSTPLAALFVLALLGGAYALHHAGSAAAEGTRAGAASGNGQEPDGARNGAKRDETKTKGPAVSAPPGPNQNVASGQRHERKPNHLIHEKSPYLLQHAYNPVDWYPWGPEAFARARKLDRPIFLSVGYATCHWCHVMERESFENVALAKLINDHFVAIKVDREERPDIDRVYMQAVQAMTGQGGWPMTVFLTPEGKPFFGGTYFPPEDRFGRPGLRTILSRIATLWRERRRELLEGAERLTAHIRRATERRGELPPSVLADFVRELSDRFDPEYGGFGSAPKFPRPHVLMALMRLARHTDAPAAERMVETTLDAMARGGIRDHLGGGFHRYSTDREWLVPHFEKMLYDQALLLRAYTEAWQSSRDPRFATIAHEIAGYVLRDLTSPEGAFYSAEDADSEGEEGRFYTWTQDEIEAALGKEDAALFCEVYGVETNGNYHEEASGKPSGRNILHLARKPNDVARAHGLDPKRFEKRLSAMRARLFEIRARRPRPLLDDKVLTDWNGLMIGALAYAGRALEEPVYTAAARRAAELVWTKLRDEHGALLHRYRDGEAAIAAFLDDHAFLLWGLLELYQSSFEVRWLERARALADTMVERFHDEKLGGFRFRSQDHEPLVASVRDAYDGALPSGNSLAAYALAVLGLMSGEPRYTTLAAETIEAFAADIRRVPSGYPVMLMAYDLLRSPGFEVVLAGEPDDPVLIEMRRRFARRFLPNSVLVHAPAVEKERMRAGKIVRYLEPLVPKDGRPTAYVCHEHTCSAPVHDMAAFERRLTGAPGR